jgi:hypothetical protein
MYLPTPEQFFSSEDPSKPDIAFLKNHFYREGRLTEEQALFILEKYVSTSISSSRMDANVEQGRRATATGAQLAGSRRTHHRYASSFPPNI